MTLKSSKTAAIEAIDRTLHQRGHIHLIIGQPLRLLRKMESSSVRQESLPSNAKAVPIAGVFTVQQDALSSSGVLSDQPIQFRPQNLSFTARPTAAISGTSKRPASPTTIEQGKAKKTKTTFAPSLPCPVCEQTPHHLIKNCPLVISGPQRYYTRQSPRGKRGAKYVSSLSIAKQILRLEENSDANSLAIVRVLRKILSKGKSKEKAGDDATVPIHLDLSD